MIGMDNLQGTSRFDFGIVELLDDVSLVSAMIGFYAVPEVIKPFAKGKEVIKLVQ